MTPAMFDCEQIFQHANPVFYRKHPFLSAMIINFFRILWNEAEYKKLEALNIGKHGVELIDAVMEYLDFATEIPENDIPKIPVTGPLVIVANHPNMFDGVCLTREIFNIRQEVKMIALEPLTTIAAAKPFIIPVNKKDEKLIAKSIQETNSHLQQGGAVIFFPAGRLSDRKNGYINDYKWGRGFYRFALDNNAQILPVYIQLKKQHTFFWLSKLLFPLCYRHQKLTFHIGDLINPKNLEEQDQTLEQKTLFIREKVYLMRLPDK